MRVVTTSNRLGLEQYGRRWLDSRKNWPQGPIFTRGQTKFVYYTEGFDIPQEYWPIECKDLSELTEFTHWKAKYRHYIAPMWRWDVVRFANKIFAMVDAMADYDGIGVWCDADVVTFDKIPDGFVEDQLGDAFIALYQRTGTYSETGLWLMQCNHPQKKPFLNLLRNWYLGGKFRQCEEWVDCIAVDMAIKALGDKIKVKNLSGEHSLEMHPQALSEFGKYCDHTKGLRKAKGYSMENTAHMAARA